MITLTKEFAGRILDIGGGGEGIIGRLYREQVTAVDNCREELDEAPEGFEKMLMDAADLKFSDCSFDHVTSFFTLMFMNTEEQKRAITEAARVLKKGGKLHIRDCDIESAYPEPFCIELEIQLPGEHISTAYGVGKLDVQDRKSIAQMCMDVGLVSLTECVGSDGFYLQFKKEE